MCVPNRIIAEQENVMTYPLCSPRSPVAKRIGLLFSTADTGVNLPIAETEDIPDVMSEDGKTEMCLASLLGGYTADHVCAICESLFAVECTLMEHLV